MCATVIEASKPWAYPEFNSVLNSFPAFPPNLDVKYTDVVARIYPLPAQIDILAWFCDQYLNHFPEHPEEQNIVPVRFHPAAPFVMLEVVNYGRMASNIANAGWFSQHELAFGLPLEMQEYRSGQWCFVKWAMCYPFIYVDSALSMSGGRQVYGWTKEFFYVDAQAPIFEPTGPKLLLHASLEAHSKRTGAPEIRTFLTVSQEQLAYSARSIVPDVLTAIPRAITSSLQAAYEILGASGLTRAADSNATSRSVFAMLQRFYGEAYSFLGLGDSAAKSGASASSRYTLPPVSLITFKQFRDAVDPKKACFQGIVETQMRVDSVKDARLMSDLAAPEASAGITLALLDDEAQPVVKMLGIECEMNGARDNNGMVRIKPVMPFWVQMDVAMGCASRQVWRTPWSGWTENIDTPSLHAIEPIDYVELGSGAGDELCAPFNIPNGYLRMRVLPLKADWEKLTALIKGEFAEKLDIAPIEKIDGDGIVCLILSGFDLLTANHQIDRTYTDFELTFAIPIKWRPIDVADAPYTYGLFPAYTFVGEAWNAITTFEVYGRLALQSSFVNAPNSWNQDLPPDFDATGFDLSVRTNLFSATSSSPTAQDLEVVNIQFVKPPSSIPASVPSEQYLKTLGFITREGKLEVSSLALKQIRDAIDPSRADLQIVVQLDRTFTPDAGYLMEDVARWLPQLKVTLRDYATLPFATTLGLTKYADPLHSSVGDGMYCLIAATPFYFVGAMLGDPAIQIPQSVGSNKFAASLLPVRPSPAVPGTGGTASR